MAAIPWIVKWCFVSGALFFVYFLWAFSKWTNTRNSLKDGVRFVKRNYRRRVWISNHTPLEQDHREQGKEYAYEKLLDDTEELLQ